VQGLSVVLLHGLVSAADCEVLRAEASSAACIAREVANDSRSESTRTLAPYQANVLTQPTTSTIRMPIIQMLGASGRSLCDKILLGGVARLAKDLPSLLPALFGDFRITEAASVTQSSHLVFTPGEPACNVYSVGGRFTPHEDRQSLTILVPLSSTDDYAGGGTGFWSRAARGHTGVDASKALQVHGAPSIVLQPPPGTAMIFGGDMTHAAELVASGERVVFVSSFSPIATTGPPSWVQSLSGQPRWVQWLGAMVEAM
jgi:hypothetical protein